MSHLRSQRRRAAGLCLAALAFAALVLPGLHGVVHVLEDAFAHAATAPRVRVTASRKGAVAPARHAHDHGHEHAPARHRHRHDREPDRRGDHGGHGAGSPEHLQALLLAIHIAVRDDPAGARRRDRDPVRDLVDRLAAAPSGASRGARTRRCARG